MGNRIAIAASQPEASPRRTAPRLAPLLRDSIDCGLEYADSLLIDAECMLSLDWDKSALERCAAVLYGVRAIILAERRRIASGELDHHA